VGTAEEEAKARLEIERAAMNRQADAIKAAEAAAKKAAEDAANKASMVAEEPGGAVATGWPDNEVQPAQGRLAAVAGALGVGKAGDAALARRLLEGERPAGGVSVEQSGATTEGARRFSGGLNVRGASPAVER
jgi:hypothetical protein